MSIISQNPLRSFLLSHMYLFLKLKNCKLKCDLYCKRLSEDVGIRPVYLFPAVSKRPNYLLGRFETFLVLKWLGQFKTWFQNGQINNLAVLKPHLISKFFSHKEAMINIKR